MARVKLTKRDHQLFQVLSSFGLLSSRQLNQLVFSGVDYRTVLRRLRKLEKLKMIARSVTSRGGQCIWYLKPLASRRIGQECIVKAVNRNMVEHDLLVNDVRMALGSHHSFLQWKSGHHLKHVIASGRIDFSQTEVIPDWLVRVNTKNGMRNISFEVELSYKGKKRMHSIFLTYCGKKEVIASIWYFVPTHSFGRKILAASKDVAQYNSMPKSWLYYCLVDDFLKDPFQTPLYGLDGSVFLADIIKDPAHASAQPVGKSLCS